MTVQFHYPKLTCSYNRNVDNDYFKIDFVAFEGEGKRPPSEIQGGGKSGGNCSGG